MSEFRPSSPFSLGSSCSQRRNSLQEVRASPADANKNDNAAATSGADATTQEEMPVEVMDMFREAQQNILELNRSRLVALEELQLARARIEDLEERCLEAERKAAEASAMLVQGSAGTASSSSSSQQMSGVTLRYITGWEEAYVHYADAEGQWTTAPGEQMTKVDSKEDGKGNVFEVSLPASASFVVNNGGGDWDQPGSGHGANYEVKEPGVYTLSKGELKKDR